nr:hypothetical protein 1 [Gammaproteobacteria bacterium]
MACIISGHILSHSFGGKEDIIHGYNMSVLDKLPEYGGMLLRSMFSLAPLDHRLHINVYQVIHFAASYDEIYSIDGAFMGEYEKLLAELCWFQSTVFHSYTGMRVELKSKDHEIGNPAIPTRSWSKTYYDSYYSVGEVESA